MDNFNEVDISDDFNVTITNGNLQSVELKTSDNIITSVSNNKLTVTTRGSIRMNGKIGLQIVLPSITKIKLSDDVDCKLSGTGKSLEVKILDNSNLDGFNFNTKECNVSISDDSKMSIHCSHVLNGNVFDDSELLYKGNPEINVKTSDHGKITNVN